MCVLYALCYRKINSLILHQTPLFVFHCALRMSLFFPDFPKLKQNIEKFLYDFGGKFSIDGPVLMQLSYFGCSGRSENFKLKVRPNNEVSNIIRMLYYRICSNDILTFYYVTQPVLWL